MANNNTSLHKAKNAKQDEFYTQRSDIENELHYYREHFKGKVIYCNCDDPRVSEFFRYFSYNFEAFGLKKLMATCYKNQDMGLFSKHDSEQAVYLEYTGDKNRNKVPDLDEIEVKPLNSDGDFRSAECIELLKQADIVVTNPPFSLFREYIAQLVEYDKKFVIVGTQHALTYKEIFPLIMDSKIWLGQKTAGMKFRVPDHYIESSYQDENGQRWQSLGNVCWYTNLDIPRVHKDLKLSERYSPEKYPTYDNYGAIEVSKVKMIPEDYDGVMGVPFSFLSKFNPMQFEILGMCENEDLYGLKTKHYTRIECKDAYLKKFEKKGSYDLNARSVLFRNGRYESLYQRLLIRVKERY